MEKYLGDIVVGDIGQPQCHKCIFSLLYTCDIVVDQCHQPQCHPSATPTNAMQLLTL